MQLKQYQAETLAILRRFLEEARIAGPKAAYERIVAEPEQKARLGRYCGEYRPLEALEALEDVPYVCLRLPTGGGKTILGAHSIAVARDAWVEKDYPLVLWLVPSNTIRQQTVEAFKNQRHPYRQVLDEAFGGRVRVLDISDFTLLRPHDIGAQATIFVGTIQALRVDKTEGRKVYDHHEDLEAHFTRVSPSAPGLERDETGAIKFSFANLLHMNRPLMIVDEAHNAVSELSRKVHGRIRPSAIIEFTATPRLASNTLHNVGAQALKAEEMIKLPIMLAEHDTWQNAVNGAVARRAALQEAAKSEADYIRPIVLFQAQDKNGEVTVETLKQHLIDVEQVPPERIAIATGSQRELDGINLFDRKCHIEFVITVEALKEGWDCSFAYVFCSVANIKSATDVEQLLGRVLRMPFARRRKMAELNKAYAFVSESSFQQAAKTLCDKLVNMGFDEAEAEEAVAPAQQHGFDSGLFGPRTRPAPVFTRTVAASPQAAAALKQRPEIKVEEKSDGQLTVSIQGHVSPEIERSLIEALPESEHAGLREAVKVYRLETKDALSPSELGEAFFIPRLMADVQGELEFADTDLFLEAMDWSLPDYPARLDAGEFSVRETAREIEIDLDGEHLSYKLLGEQDQYALDLDVEGWTPENLVLWLDRQLRQPDISQGDLVRWLGDAVRHLAEVRKLPMTALMRCKFILAKKLRDKIDGFRKNARTKAYQQFLFAPEARVEVSFDQSFEFRDGMYWDQKRYRGRCRFGKHFLPFVPAFDGNEDGEEFQCAQALDSLAEVKFWLRNVARHPASFWLPTASGKFYPDFVALLKDGRLLVAEYKGADRVDSVDTAEKVAVGRLWEQKQGGLFLLVEKVLHGLPPREQMRSKISGG